MEPASWDFEKLNHLIYVKIFNEELANPSWYAGCRFTYM